VKLPIPDDWDGQDWACAQIHWPNSAKWMSILAGLISQPMRGWGWDEKTGPTEPAISIPSVQAIAWDIWLRNQPFVSCDGGDDQITPPEPQNGLFPAFGGMEGDEMPCIDISGLLKIENGVLYARNSCCEWVSIGAIAGLNEGVPDDPLNPSGDPGFVYSACGKAKAIVDIAYLIVAAGFSALADAANPFKWIPYIESTAGYDLDNNYLAGMLAEITAGMALETAQFPFGIEASDVDDPIEHQRILCRVVREFADDAIGVDADKFAAVKACFKAEMFPFSLWYGMFDYALNALGREDMNTVAKWGAGNTAENCDCPAEEAPEAFSQYGLDKAWRYVFDFRTGDNGFTLDPAYTHQTNGVGLWADNQVTEHRANINAQLPFDNVDNGSTIELIGLLWANVGDEGWMSSGTHVRVNTEDWIGDDQIIDLGGNGPATPGSFTFIVSDIHPLVAGDVHFDIGLQAEHDTDVSQKLIAVLFAGSGPGPMTA